MLKKEEKYTFGEIIEYIKNEYLKSGEESFYKNGAWCVYAKEDITKEKSICYICSYPDIDEETYPNFVIKNNLELIYKDELIQDVIAYCVNNNPKVSIKKIIEAINYYNEYDSFMDM